MRSTEAVLRVFLTAVVCSSAAMGQTARVGPEFRVNTYTTSYQESPRVARNALGEFVVVWQSFVQDNSGFGVFGQRFDASGVPEGGEFQVNTYTTDNQYQPAVSIDSGGNFTVVWQSRLQDGSLNGIYGQRYNGAGAPAGGPFRVNTFTTNEQQNPAVEHDASGNFVVVWDSSCGAVFPCTGQDGSYAGVFGQRYASTGAVAGTEFRANTATTEEQSYPSVSKADAGGFVVVWQSYNQEPTHPQDPPADYGIFGRRYAAGGVPSGNDFQINTFTARTQEAPSVSMNGPGAFVVVWESYGQLGAAGYDIVGQRYNSSGTKVGGEFVVNTYTLDDQLSPAVAMADTGGFVVVWRSRLQDGWASGIYGQRYNADGSRHGPEFRVNTYTVGEQRTPSIATDGSGNFVVTWSSAGQDGSATGVYAQRFSGADCVLPSATGPSNQTACQTGTAFFTATPSGLGPFTYQWRKNGLNLTEGGHIAGSHSQTLKVKQIAGTDAGSYSCVVSDGCLPPANATTSSGTLTVGAGQAAGAVTNLRLSKVNGGASLTLTWNNTTNATDYVIYEDIAPDGTFTAQTGTSASGVTGLTMAMPAASKFYLIAGRNAACGVGPQN